MTAAKRIIIIGLEPKLVDFSSPDLDSQPGLDASKVQHALEAQRQALNEAGYEAELCLTDLGETAEAMVRERLSRERFDCAVIGAGIRTLPRHFLLFEKLVNVLHQHAPQARICFNTKPDDTAEAVRRWL